MADWYGKSLMEDQDFQEEDVWGVVKQESNSNSNSNSNSKVNKFHKNKKKPSTSSSSSSMSSWTCNDGSRMIPRCNDGRMPHQHQQSSAPMGIPDWSKIYREKNHDGVHNHHHDDDVNDVVHDDDDDDDDDGMMVPPHEYIARRLARNHISSSMCEGIGRTLKGRDLSKLRNAILTKTGFLE